MLKDKLEAIRAMARASFPEDSQALMQRSVDEVRASGILDRVLKVGSGEPRRAAREGTGGGELFPWTLVTVLQCGAVSSAGDASRDPQGRRERRRDLSTGAARWARDRQGAGRDAPGPA